MPARERRIRALSKNKELTRQQRTRIRDAAYQVFAEKGYAASSIREVAARAGMVPGNIYRYVGSKEDILHLLCKTAHDDTEGAIAAANASASTAPTMTETLKQSIRAYLKWSDDHADAYLFYDRNVQSLCEEDRDLVRDMWEQTVRSFEKVIRKGVRRGEFKVKDPLLLSHNIASLGHDWALRKWFLGTKYTPVEFAEKQIEMIMDSVLAANARGAGPRPERDRVLQRANG
jgi:AcrR family transcriptional regulator